jgi:hypothetical protein
MSGLCAFDNVGHVKSLTSYKCGAQPTDHGQIQIMAKVCSIDVQYADCGSQLRLPSSGKLCSGQLAYPTTHQELWKCAGIDEVAIVVGDITHLDCNHGRPVEGASCELLIVVIASAADDTIAVNAVGYLVRHVANFKIQ